MDWQQAAVFAIVGGAALYLARGYFGKKKPGCGGCGSGCAQPALPEEAGDLVQIELAPPERSREGRPD